MANTYNSRNTATILMFLLLGNFETVQHLCPQGKPIQQPCSAEVVTEGETGVMTFFLRDDINFASDKVFVSVTRAKDPEKFILVCERNSPLECKTRDPHFQTRGGIEDHKVTLLIPNVTQSLQDTYVMQVYVNDNPETSTCFLTVRDKNNRPCHAPTATVGETGEMKFFIREDLNLSSAVVKKNGGEAREIVTCRRHGTSSDLKCDVKDKRYKIEGTVHQKLKLVLPDVSQDMAGNYLMQITANHQRMEPQPCNLAVEAASTISIAKSLNTNPGGITFIVSLLGIIVVLLVAFALRYFVWKGCKAKMSRKDVEDDESDLPLISSDDGRTMEELKSKRWYRKNVSQEEEEQLLHFNRNTHGSFLVKVSDTNPDNYTLVVLVERTLRYLTFIPTKRGFKCNSTRKSFRTLSDAVNHYKEHDIKVGNTSWGKLTCPFEWEPKEEWYFGQLAEKHRDKILLSEENGPGSFLISVSIKDDTGYDLSVNDRGKVCRFGIIPEDDGYRMLDTRKVFNSLSSLVQFYQQYELRVGSKDTTYGRLLRPCAKTLADVMSLEALTTETESKLLRSKKTRPGSFLIEKKGDDTNVCILAVYFEKRIKRFRIRQVDQGFRFVPTGTFFHSMYELLDYYKEHEISANDKTWGKLSKPFAIEPQEDWYVGPLGREDEEKMLLSRRNKLGAFLIRDGTTDRDNYVLACKFKSGPERHVIFWEHAGFTLINKAKHFKSLLELVQYYQENNVPSCDSSDNARTLSTPCEKNPPDVWFSERLTTDDENRYKKSKRTRPGCFLITNDDNIPYVYTLAVYFDGKITRFQVLHRGNGLVFEITGMFFYTWFELVRYFRSHDIETPVKRYGKLSRPLRKEPTEKWYTENARTENEPHLFKNCEEGCFLVRDGMTESDEYVLAVMQEGKIRHFTIMPAEDGFRLGDADTVFDTLGQLVEHYKSNDIIFAGTNFGKLRRPLRQEEKA